MRAALGIGRNFLLAASAVGCLMAAQATGAPVENISQQWAGDWNAKNLKSIMTLYAPQPVFLPASGERWDGAAEIRKQFAGLLKQFDPRLALQSVKSETSGNLAYDSGTFDETVAPTKGGAAIQAKGNYLFLFQRQKNGKWKILEQTWTQFGPAKL
jgi:uncharacterized protein (TIGR02246 family)